MNLNRKIVLVLIAGITLYTAVGFSFNRFLILPSFRQLEMEEARKDMLRCLAALDSHITQIELLCSDWSAWDDTYAFVQSPEQAYVDANLYASWFIDNDMNLMLFFRTDGTLAWGEFFDLKAGAPAPFPEFSDRAWAPDHPLLNHKNRASVVRGTIRTSLGPMLVVSRPILPSEAVDGEVIRGTLVMGRLLDDRIIQAIRDQTQVAVDIIDLDHDPLPPEATGLDLGEIRVLEESNEVLRVLTHTHDFRGRDILAFDATIPRRIMARGLSAIRLSMLAAGIAGFVFLLMLLSTMKWIVSDPLHQLRAFVQGVGIGSSQVAVPLVRRKDEIGDVAREFKRTLERLKAEEEDLVAAEKALRASQERTRTILDSAPDAIVIVDMNEQIESANQAAVGLFGRSREGFSGRPASELIVPEDQHLWRETLHRARELGAADTGAVEVEMNAQRSNDMVVPIHASVSTISLEGVPCYICAIRDISTLKSMQQKVARNQHLARIGEMGATVAHEIRNPLAGIKGAIQIVAGGTLDREEHDRILVEVQGLVNRISGTVEQLLRYAKPIEPVLELFPLKNMIESVCSVVSPQIPDGAQIHIECKDDFMIRADPRLLRQVLDNMWANACQALQPPWRLDWIARNTGGMVWIQLSNDGKPVREADLSRVFEPFFTTRVDGTGLGLAVSLRIIEAHDGTMYIENCGESQVSVSVQLPQGD